MNILFKSEVNAYARVFSNYRKHLDTFHLQRMIFLMIKSTKIVFIPVRLAPMSKKKTTRIDNGTVFLYL